MSDAPLTVPSSIDTAQLNTLLLELLKDESTPLTNIEFDFLINEKLLRTPLTEHLTEYSISNEVTVDVEYIIRNPAPEPEDCLLHDDWVSACSIQNKYILTGCYDNTIHLWTIKGNHKLVIPGHNGPVKAVEWVKLDNENGIFVTGSHDQNAILWHWNVHENAVQCVNVLRGHERGIECIRVQPEQGLLFASAGWDTFIKLWSSKLDEDDSPDSSKKQRVNESGESSKTRVPIVTLQGHKEAINGLAWVDVNTLCTASWDHTIKLWDIELNGIKKEIVGNKAFFDVDYSKLNNLLVTGSADRHVRIYDTRSNDGAVVKGTYTSHTQWIQTVRWSLNNEHLFISGGHDKVVKMWDLRSARAPLFDFTGHDDKILCCDWKDGLIISGAADNTLRILKEANK